MLTALLVLASIVSYIIVVVLPVPYSNFYTSYNRDCSTLTNLKSIDVCFVITVSRSRHTYLPFSGTRADESALPVSYGNF